MTPEAIAVAVLAVTLACVLIATWVDRVVTPRPEHAGLDIPTEPVQPCPGPLVWFDVEGDAAVLECNCGFVCTTGNSLDEAHANRPLLREGLAA